MRPALAALAIAGTLILPLSPSAQAGPRGGAHFADPTGDWVVPWQDVVAGDAVVTGGHGATVSRVRLSMDTAVELLPGTSGTYDAMLGSVEGATCHLVAARARWLGPEVIKAYRIDLSLPCRGEADLGMLVRIIAEGALEDATAAPAQASVAANRITFDLAAPAWLTRGRLVQYSVVAHPATWTMTGVNGKAVQTCDQGYLQHLWRVR